MQDVLIVNVSHRGVALETQQSIARCASEGARLLSWVGTADVALARNQALTQALAQVEAADLSTPIDVLLLVDDDMVFLPGAARDLCERARADDCWSAVYATKDAKAAATRLRWDGREQQRWMTGLGFCAVPVRRLQRLATELGEVVGPDGALIVPFCQSSLYAGAPDGITRWCSEDYWLCLALGGMRLAPVRVGHLKTVPLWPDDDTLRRFCSSSEPEQ